MCLLATMPLDKIEHLFYMLHYADVILMMCEESDMAAQPKPKRLTPRADVLRKTLEGSTNHWFTRREIALKVGKKRLTPYEIDLLHLLAEKGAIQISQEEGYSRDGYRWLYGVFDNASNALEEQPDDGGIV
jgi:hypothetical protein